MSEGLFTHPIVSVQWSGASVGINGQSAGVQIFNAKWVSIFGNVSAATTITVMYSADGANWYGGQSTTLGGAGNFHFDLVCGAEWIALQSSAAATITAIVSAKG